MAAYSQDVLIVNDSLIRTSDDIYVKVWPHVDPWTNGMIDSPVSEGTTVYVVAAANLDTENSYICYRNDSTPKAFTTDYLSDANQIDLVGHGWIEGTMVMFKGSDLPAPLSQAKRYWLINVMTDYFEVEAVQGSGTPVTFTDNGSGSMTVTSSSDRISTDTKVAYIPALESSLQGEGDATVLNEINERVHKLRNAKVK
jgi:hypothetical protein